MADGDAAVTDFMGNSKSRKGRKKNYVGHLVVLMNYVTINLLVPDFICSSDNQLWSNLLSHQQNIGRRGPMGPVSSMTFSDKPCY